MIPSLALLILRARSVFSGTAYVIVLGVNAIASSPLIDTDLMSPGVNNKSPCTTPRIPNFGNSFKHTDSLSTKPPA